jgi:Rrf2 family cysteine metabolism transcriptional repressor
MPGPGQTAPLPERTITFSIGPVPNHFSLDQSYKSDNTYPNSHLLGDSVQILTETSISALQALLYLAVAEPEAPVAPRHIAHQLGLSPTYTAKILRHLVRARILQSYRGSHGGVTLNRPAADISLLEVAESCQGKILGHFCQETTARTRTCAFHQAMADLNDAVSETLGRWSLGDLCAKPVPSASLRSKVDCRMAAVINGHPD